MIVLIAMLPTSDQQPTINNRSSDKEPVQTNGVHPKATGKLTFADLLIPVIVALDTNS